MTIRNSISSALFLATAVAIPWYAGAMAQTMVVVGDSLSAGYLNSSLHQKQQPRGFASVVADQAGIDLPLPLVNAPGLPSLLKLKRGTGEIGRAAGVSNGRVDPTVQAYNLAVPGATAYHALSLAPVFSPPPATRVQGFTDLILGLPGVFTGQLHSQVEWAQMLDPDIVVLWVGGQDALLGLINGTDAAATDPGRFADHFAGIMNALAGTGAKVMVANVPVASDIPFLLSRYEAAAFLGVDEAVLEIYLGIDLADSVTLDALGPMAAELLGEDTDFFNRDPTTCFVIEAENLPAVDPPSDTCGDYILTADELVAIDAKTTAYNAVIDSVETDYPGVATLVDMEDFFDDVSPFILVDGHQFLGTSYLGGIFSLDGIHPTFAAQALIADEFIARINDAYEAGGYVGEFIPPLSRQQIRAALKSDPLVFQLPGNPPPPLGPMFALGEGDTVSGLLGIAAPGS